MGNNQKNVIGIKCKICINPEMNDENLFLFLNLLESAGTGMYDLLKQEIVKNLDIKMQNGLDILVQRTDANSMDAVGGDDDDYANMVMPESNDTIQKTWKCASCTFENHYLVRLCEVCQTPKVQTESNIIHRMSIMQKQEELISDNQFVAQGNQLEIVHSNSNHIINDVNDVNDDNMAEREYLFQPISKEQQEEIVQKQLFVDIEQDNKNVPAGDGGIWTGDLVDDDEKQNGMDLRKMSENDLDLDDLDVDYKESEELIAESKQFEIDDKNDIDAAYDDPDEKKDAADDMEMDIDMIPEMEISIVISDIDGHDELSPNVNEDSDMKEDELFVTADGFDDLREPDVFG